MQKLAKLEEKVLSLSLFFSFSACVFVSGVAYV